jgi:hypothetical protein
VAPGAIRRRNLYIRKSTLRTKYSAAFPLSFTTGFLGKAALFDFDIRAVRDRTGSAPRPTARSDNKIFDVLDNGEDKLPIAADNYFQPEVVQRKSGIRPEIQTGIQQLNSSGKT